MKEPGPTDPRAGTDRVLEVAGGPIAPLTTGLVVAGNEALCLTGGLTGFEVRLLLLEVVVALLSLRGLVEVDFWLSEVTLEVGTDAGLVVPVIEARGAIEDRGLTVLVLEDGRIVDELTEEASARGFVPVPDSVAFEVEAERALVAGVTLGLPDRGRGTGAGLVVLTGVAVVLEDSLDTRGRAGGTGGFVVVLAALEGTKADLGLEPGSSARLSARYSQLTYRIHQILKLS
jgi:hypothetical protein